MIVLQHQECKLGTSLENRGMEDWLRYGIAIINKPMGPSSHEVSAFVRKILHLKIAGHTGTLDQNVSGVLVVLLEDSRKAASYIARSEKKYVCVMTLGKELGRGELEGAFSHFRGEIYQRPPLESAVAKKLRIRRITQLKILEIGGRRVLFECECEAGTYIRKLVFDLGEVLGVKAEMTELRRVLADGFTEAQAITLQQLSDYYWAWSEKGEEKYLRKAVIPMEHLKFRKIFLADDAAVKIKNGVKPLIGNILRTDDNIRPLETVALCTGMGELIAIGETAMSSEQMQGAFKENKHHLIAANIRRVIHPF